MEKIIKITTEGGKPFINQLPSQKNKWGEYSFSVNEDIPECDMWVIWGGLNKPQKTICTKGNTLFITNEPPSVKKYSTSFLNQFSTILTCESKIKHKEIIQKQQCLPWWIGFDINNTQKDKKTYDQLINSNITEKTKNISIIISNKKFTAGHEKRVVFLKKLQEIFKDNLDVYGKGFNEIPDKWDALAPYKYTIVFENSSINDYWTEKLSDAFLCNTYPIYYGCKNIYDYFPKNSLTLIDINNLEDAIKTIKKIIEDDYWEKSKADLLQAKDMILNKYQLFPTLISIYKQRDTDSKKEQIIIYPENINLLTRIWKKITTFLQK